ncbi:MAG: Sua5/YciO/YrdC/YwlC family protein, partial [Patescibacteria group bacterium]
MKRIVLKKENSHVVISEAKKTLQNGGLVIFPSDTVYGVAVNAQSVEAVDKLFQFKNRSQNKAVSIAVKS